MVAAPAQLIQIARSAAWRAARWLRHAPDRLLHPLRRAVVSKRLRVGGGPESVLVLCHGNICRSPYGAAALARALSVRSRVGVRIESAGFLGSGRPAPPEAITAAAARGVDLSAHRSSVLTLDAVRRAGVIVVMDAAQRRAIRQRFGRGVQAVVLLGDLDPEPVSTRAIPDPVNGSARVFEECYARIGRCIDALAAAMAGPSAGERPPASTPPAASAATPAGAGLLVGDWRPSAAARPGAHHFTVDVEEYFHVSAFERRIPRSAWDTLESRVVRSTFRLLELLDRHDARATFFVLGWVALRHPELVRAIADAGHEVASHGWDHRRITRQGREEFRASVRRSRTLLEDLTGRPVLGFRAPSFSIVPGREWALDVLIEEGHGYDSSLFPVRRPGYGYSGVPQSPHWIHRPAGRLLEVPPATLRRWSVTLPAGGGAYFRLLPYRLVAQALRDFEQRDEPATFYIHPWELDPEQPRLPVPWPTRLRHYGGLNRTTGRLERLLSEFRFTRIADTIALHDCIDTDHIRRRPREIAGRRERAGAHE